MTTPDSPDSHRRRHLHAAFGAALASASSVIGRGAQAQTDRPPIKLIIGFPVGGTIDLCARVLADAMKDDLGQPIVVESRPGAGGQIAAQVVKGAPPDGRTLLLAPDHTMVMVPLTIKSPGFTVAQDFVPIGGVARYAGGFAVAAQVPARNLAEYLQYVRANPQRGTVGVPAPGSIPQFVVHRLAGLAQVPLQSVPYRGSAPLVQELMGGQIVAGTTALGDFVESHQARKLRVIGVLGGRRSPVLPDVATLSEQGLGIEWEYWLGLFAPSQTPAMESSRLSASLQKTLGRPDVRERFRQIVFETAVAPGDQLNEWVRSGTALWEPVVRSSGWVLQ